MYADRITDSMDKAISETNQRQREIQQRYNEEHGITPQTIKKAVRDLISISKTADKPEADLQKDMESMTKKELEALVGKLTKKMHTAAADLNFELAAQLRDEMIEVKKYLHDYDQ